MEAIRIFIYLYFADLLLDSYMTRGEGWCTRGERMRYQDTDPICYNPLSSMENVFGGQMWGKGD